MDEMKYALLTEVVGRWRADVIENFLKSEEIDVVLVQESVSELFTTSFSPVKIYVPKACIKLARELLKTLEEEEDNT